MSSTVPPSDSQLVEQLRQSLGMLQVAFDAAAEAMLIVDEKRRIHWANQASAQLLVNGVPSTCRPLQFIVDDVVESL